MPRDTSMPHSDQTRKETTRKVLGYFDDLQMKLRQNTVHGRNLQLTALQRIPSLATTPEGGEVAGVLLLPHVEVSTAAGCRVADARLLLFAFDGASAAVAFLAVST